MRNDGPGSFRRMERSSHRTDVCLRICHRLDVLLEQRRAPPAGHCALGRHGGEAALVIGGATRAGTI